MRSNHRLCLIAGVTAFLLFPSATLLPLAIQDSQEALENRIGAEISDGRIDSAETEARRAVEQFPRSSQLRQLLGVALFKKGLNGEARAAFRRAIELDASVPQNHFNLALVELSEGHYADAVLPLETCVRLDPQNAEARLLLGRAYHNLNRTLPAIEQFKKALALQPGLPLAHYHLGYAYQSLGNRKTALEEFKMEVKRSPTFYESYWRAGNIELERGHFDAAEALFRKGVSLKAQAYQAHYGLARVLLARKQFQEAEGELKEALRSNPNNVEVHYALARAYQGLGKHEEAQREFQACTTLHARSEKRRSGIAGGPVPP